MSVGRNRQRRQTRAEGRDRASHARAPRLLFYSSDLFGLGHLRKILAIASAVAERRPDVAMKAFTSIGEAAGFAKPDRLEWVTLPPIAPGTPLPPAVAAARRATIEATIDDWRPDAFFVDHLPQGTQGELLYPLACLRGGEPHVTLICGTSDITDDPATVREVWSRVGAFDVLDRTYDRIVVYCQREIFDAPREYGFSPAGLAKTEFVGYLSRPKPDENPAQVRERLGLGDGRLVVVTTGGGADGAPLLHHYLTMLGLDLLPADVVSLVVAGPRMGDDERATIDLLAASLPRLSVVPSLPDLVNVLNAADLVVTMGGYNTLAEAVGLGKRTLVVPRVEPWREKLIRAQRFSAYGLVTMLHPIGLTAERLAWAIRQALASPPPTATLRFGGADRIADLLIDAFPSRAAQTNR
jgi:predicted glycosyltransferase